MEVIVLTDEGIMIQEIENFGRESYQPVLRFPNNQDIVNIRNGLALSIKLIAKTKRLARETNQMQRELLKINIEKYGEENVEWAKDGTIYVTVNGKRHKIWVEST